MGGRPLWKCGAGRMVPENTNSATVPAHHRLSEPLPAQLRTTINLFINQLVINITGTAAACASLKLHPGG
jgi:hypothetical protein